MCPNKPPENSAKEELTDEVWKPLKGCMEDHYRAKTINNSIWADFVCKQFPHKSASPPTCPPNCGPCKDSFTPLTSRSEHAAPNLINIQMHSDSKADSIIQHLIGSTQDNYSYIRTKISLFGNIISKRWQKKTIVERQQLIHIAMPAILETRCSNLEYAFEDHDFMARLQTLVDNGSLTTGSFPQRPADRRAEEKFLVPFLNAQSLSENKTRPLALIHYRANAHPAEWISFDREAMRDEFHSSALKTAYNPHCVSINLPGEKFGDLVPWEKEAAHRFQTIGYPLARHIFRAQFKISQALRKIFDLLADPTIHTLPKGSTLWDALADASFCATRRLVQRAAYNNQAFSPAPKPNFAHNADRLRARHDAAFDEVQLVHADPSYLRHVLKQAEDSELFEDRDEECKRKMLFLAPFQSIFHYEVWDRVQIGLGMLWFTSAMQQPDAESHSPLPRAYDNSLIVLEAHLRVGYHRLSKQLLALLSNHASFRKHFKGSEKITSAQTAYRHDPMFWILCELTGESGSHLELLPSWCFSFFEDYLATSGRKERHRIDQVLYDHLADMAAIDEALTAIVLHPYRTTGIRTLKASRMLLEEMNKSAVLSGIMQERTWLNQYLESCYYSPAVHKALSAFRCLPLTAEPGTPEKLAEHKMLHEKFHTYWNTVHDWVMKQANISRHEDTILRALEQKLQAFRSEQMSTFERQQRDIEEEIVTKAAEGEIDTTGFNLHNRSLEPEQLNVKSLIKDLKSKAKIKTRPSTSKEGAEARSDDDDQLSNAAETSLSQSQKSISVSAKTAELFRQMFSPSTLLKTQRDWDELVAAFVDAGCSAVHNGGSVVTFEDQRNGSGSIVLHKPHPKTTVHPIMLRSIGQRLTKRLGWDAGTFVEHEKEDGGEM